MSLLARESYPKIYFSLLLSLLTIFLSPKVLYLKNLKHWLFILFWIFWSWYPREERKEGLTVNPLSLYWFVKLDVTSLPLYHAVSSSEMPCSPFPSRGKFESKLYFVRIYYLIVNADYNTGKKDGESAVFRGKRC